MMKNAMSGKLLIHIGFYSAVTYSVSFLSTYFLLKHLQIVGQRIAYAPVFQHRAASQSSWNPLL
jgi:hypothetical protein